MGCMRVPQIVEADLSNTGGPHAPLEVVTKEGGVQRPTTLAAEEQLLVVEFTPDRLGACDRLSAMLSENVDRLTIKRADASASGGLRHAPLDIETYAHDRLNPPELPVFEIDIAHLSPKSSLRRSPVEAAR